MSSSFTVVKTVPIIRSLPVDVYPHERQYGYQVYKAVERKDVVQARYPRILMFRILHGGGGNPKAVLDGEDERGQVIEQIQPATVWGGLFERAVYNRKYRAYDEEQHEILEPLFHQLAMDGSVEFLMAYKSGYLLTQGGNGIVGIIFHCCIKIICATGKCK